MLNAVEERGLGSTTLIDLLRTRAQNRPADLAYTFLSDAGTEVAELTYAELDRRARALAAELQRLNATGERALLLFPPGLDFVVAFLGCLYAGAVAVPAYPPKAKRVQSRLRSIARDSQPRVVLTTAVIHERSEELLHQVPELAGAAWISAELVSPDRADAWQPFSPGPESLAFLQYTSGSTSAPKGVMVTHGNLMHNEEMIRSAFGQSESSVIVGWLPLYHDMGLIGNVLQPLYLGARCVLMSPLTFLQKPLRWLEAISRYGATTSGGPNFAYDLCARKILPGEEEGLDLSRWILAYNGAEPVRADTLKRFARRFAACGFRHESFYPCYGLAEATLFVTGAQRQTTPAVLTVSASDIEEHRITPVEDGQPGARRFVSCGYAWLDQEVAVVDPESGLPCPEGRVGEIWISGPSVAAGYWQQPEATERSFRARLPQKEGTFLRTGDLGFAQGGQLFITGRLKDLIIVRGRNLYPQDLELTAERSHPAVRAGCSAAFAITVDGEERLVLTCEVERRPEADPQAVAAAVRGAVAEEFEVQVQDVVLLRAGTIPKTSSGKIQRHACRAGYLGGVEGGLEIVASSPLVDEVELEVEAEPVAVDRSVLQWLPEEERRGALASYLRGVLAELVRVPASRLDPDQPVTNLGLDSLGAVGLTHRLETDLAVSFPLADLFQGPTLTELVDQVLERLRQAPEAGAPASVFDAATGPLSYGQRAIWFLQRLAPESAAYNIAVAGRLETGWDTAALRRTLERVVERHPALRTSFGIEDGEPVQRIRETGGVEVFAEDASGWSDEEVAVRRLELAYRPFDLETDRLVRWAEFRHGAETDFLLVVHHIVSDLWSLVVLLRDLEGLYLNASASLPAPMLTPLAHAVRQRERIEGPEGERLWDFWSRRLAGELPASAMPTDRPRPPVQTFAGSSSRLQLPADLLAGVQETGRRQGATLYITLLAAFQALLFRYSGQEDQLVGSPTAGRDTADLSGVIGYFVNPVVLRSDLSGDPGFSGLIRRVRGTVLEAFEHQDYPFPRLVERLQPERDPSRSPLFQVMFVLQASRLLGAEGLSAFALGEEGGRMELAGLGVRSARLEHRAAQFDLELIAAETGNGPGGLGMSLLFNTDLFDAATADRLLQHLAVLLQGAVADPEARLSRLPLLTAAERSQMLSAWNDTARPFPLDRTFQELFEAQAARTPETVAAVDSQNQITYRELNRRANRLARFLLDQGAAPEGPVAVLSERGVDLLTAMIAAFKAGAVYVPLDPKHPRTRSLQTVEQSGSRLVLVADALRPLLPEEGTSWKTLSLESAIAAPFPDGDLGVRAFPESLAYVIYTSGSTGTPKGAMVEQRGMVNHLWAKIADLELTASDRIAQTASQSFDISVWQFLAALLVGGETRVFDDAVAHDPVRLLEEVETAGVTVLETVPSMLRATLEAGSGPALAALRWMIPTGESLAPDLCDLWLARYPAIPLVNAYGPTECSDDITHAFLRAPLPPGAAQAPIGRPVPNLRIYVLDRGLEPVPVNVPGEIYAGGIGVGRGYLGDPARTAEVFVPDHFTPGLRLYRTGDLGRWREDGQLEFLGRVDHQVKIRGFRIELGEIEALIAGHPAVRQAVVLARPDVRGERRLVAYVTVDPETALTTDALRGLAQESLPEYMVPSAFVVLPEMPLTAVGKIDRRALPEPDWAGDTAQDLALPRTPMEELIAGIWAEVLGLERVGVDSSFFELGGHSLLATQVVSRIRGALDVEIPLRALFELPGVARLAELVESSRETARPEAPPLRRVPRVDVPLSFAQQRLWFLYQLDPSSPAYNMPGLVRLSGPLDSEALRGSLAEMVRRHESLRTVFPASLGEPRQEILPELAIDLPLTDLSDLASAEAEARLQALVQEEGRSPFDLQHGPLLRTRLVRLAAEEHALVLNLHHIVSDGWSQGVLVRELSRLYEAFAASQPSPLPELPVQYADYAVWQRDWLQGDALESLLSWWRGQLAGSPGVLDLPLDHPRPPAFTYRGSRLPVHLPAGLADRLHAFGRRGSVTPFMILLAGFQALLHRHSGQSDLVIGTAIANRQQTELEDLVGFFMNTLALRADLHGSPRFADLLEQARRTSLGAYAHQGLPFEKLVDELQPERDLSRSPLVQVMLILQNAPMRGLQLPGLEVRVDEVHNDTAKLDLTVNLEETDAGIVGWIEYNVDLFDRPTVARLVRHFETLLDAALAAPQASIESLPLVGDAERFQLLAEWNDTGVPTEPACVHHLFEAQARRTPEAVAVSAGSRQLTYADLNARANRLAHRLRALGVGTEVRVGLCVDRTPEMVVGLLGILKAGGSYLPLDPAYPADRLAWMLADSAAPVVAVEPATAEALPPHGARVVVIDPDPGVAGFADESADDPAPLAHPDLPESTAYVIYTSGSTGRPKGVQVPHGALVNFLESMRQRPGLGPDDVLLSVTTLSFDIAGLELFLPLIAGARVALVERAAVSDASRLRAELESTGATVMQATPITWHLLLESGWPGSPNLKVLCGGEAFPRDLARALVERVGSVWNMYGPTETTIWSAVSQVLPASGPVPIGRPIANTTIHLLDRGGSPVPVGVPGELLIGGHGVARGYLNRPDLTAERFVPAGWGEDGSRLYRTGDLARRLPDGSLEFLGRIDHQIKVRGYRIELQEIEAVLAQHPEVREAVVTVRDGSSGVRTAAGFQDKRLVAYVIPVSPDAANPTGLRAFLRERLPEYMVPAAFVRLEKMPLTPNGKVDRKALPEPEGETLGRSVAPPRSAVEEMVAGVWSQILGSAEFGIHDNFFDLGGHSLLAAQVMSRLQAALRVELPLRLLFEKPTVATLAETVETLRREGRSVDMPPVERVPRDQSLPLSFAQERLWVMCQLVPDHSVYNVFQALRFQGELDLDLLERSFAAVIRRHESLRTSFATEKGSPVQRIAGSVDFHLPVVDLMAEPAERREAAARELAVQEVRTPFDLASAPLLRVRALRLDDRDHVLLVNMHHLVCDNWSIGVLNQEIAALYGAAGASDALTPLPFQYPDFAVWQRRWMNEESLRGDLDYWTARLSGEIPVLQLPTDRPRPAVQTFRGSVRTFELPADLTRAIETVSLREGKTLFMTLLAAFATVLHRASGQDDIIIGSPVANRELLETEALIGFFVNILPMRIDLAGEPTYRELLDRVQRTALEAYDHQRLSFERMVEALQLKRDLSRAALRQVGFAFQNAADASVTLPGGIAAVPMEVDAGISRLDMTLFLWKAADGTLRGSWEYSTDLFEASTVDRLLGLFRHTLEDLAADPERHLLEPSEAAAKAPGSELTESQLLFWFAEKLQTDVQLYFDRATTMFTVAGEIDPRALETALNALIQASDALRSQIHEFSGVPRRIVQDRLPVTLDVFDLSGESDPDAADAAFAAWLEARCERRIDLGERLFDCALVRLGADRTVWFWNVHHIIADAWSLTLTAQHLSRLYLQALQGPIGEIDPLPPYQEYVDFEREARKTERYQRSKQYWAEKLARPLNPNPFYRRDAGAATTRVERLSVDLGPERSDRIRGLARQQGFFSGAVIFASTLMAWLHRLSGETTLRVGTPFANRPERFRQTMGLMMNAAPLQVHVADGETLLSLARKVQVETVETSRHQGYPVRNPAEARAYDVYFNFQIMSYRELCGLPACFELLNSGHSNDHLDLQASDFTASGSFRLDLDFNVAAFDEAQRQRSVGHYLSLLDGLIGNPEQPLGDAPMLSAAETDQLLRDFNDTVHPYSEEPCLHRLIARQAERTPDAVAVSYEGTALTYAQLDRRANQLAHHLIGIFGRGAQPDRFVGLCVERSLEMMIGLLGIQKAGCAYVPLDPTYPQERLEYMSRNAACPVLLTQERLLGQLPASEARVVCLDRDWPEIATRPETDPGVPSHPESLAYMIYTSGSTGRPKGAMLAHAGVVNRIVWMQEAYGLTPADRVLQKTPFSFDVSVWELFWPLLTGARLVMAQPGGHQDPRYLVDTIAKEGITTLHFVPSMLQVFLEQPDLGTACASVKRVFCSGEALPDSARQRFFERLPGAQLHNLYGPTEASVDVTYWECGPTSPYTTVPIGRPIANTQIYILDRYGNLAPPEIPGELHIGGVCLARGYHARPDLTAERFVPDPFGEPGARLYRTGDLVRHLPDGNIEFLGRLDFQVKIRGFRIELAEIEAALMQHPGLAQAIVMAREDRPGDRRLVAYLTVVPDGPDGPGAPSFDELRALIRGQLPDYMVPAAFVQLETMPLTPSGKVDRRALPVPGNLPEEEKRYVAPRTPLETFLAGVFADVLGVERVSVHGDFFDLGGNSLMATQVATLVQEVLPLEIPLRKLFEARTVAAIAQAILDSEAEMSPEEKAVMAQMLAEMEQLFAGDEGTTA